MKASISPTGISLAAPALHKFDSISRQNNSLKMSEMHPLIQKDDLMTPENIWIHLRFAPVRLLGAFVATGGSDQEVAQQHLGQASLPDNVHMHVACATCKHMQVQHD